MPDPSSSDWNFDEVAKVDAPRARRLEAAPAFEMIIAQVKDALSDALAQKQYRCGTDCYQGHRRAIFQFRVSQELYDNFFNSRSGYRAQFWISPDRGHAANLECLDASLQIARASLPDRLDARVIETTDEPYEGRRDIDVGVRVLPLEFLTVSLAHPAAKIWICERLITGHQGSLKPITCSSGEQVSVLRWKTTISPCPSPEWTWLDLKGGFVGGRQPKDSSVRARDIHLHGFS